MLPNSNILAPHVLIGDEAFQLRQDFLRPFPGKQLSTMRQIFNYRLSRARRCIECAFGLLANRWRVYRSPIYLMPNNVDKVIKATIVLHNYMINEDNVTGKAIYCPSGYMDHIDENGIYHEGAWNTENQNEQWEAFRCNNSRNYSNAAAEIRENFARYFVTEGEVSWQWNRNRTES